VQHLLKNFKKGFSLVELLVVAGIFATAVGAFFGAASISFRAVAKASDKIQAAFLLGEGLEGVRYMRDLSWMSNLSTKELGYESCLLFDPANNMFSTTNSEIVGLWHLDETSGSVFADSSTYGNNSSPCTSCPTQTSGYLNASFSLQNARRFDGSSQFISIPDSVSLSPAGDFSVDAWINFSTGPSGGSTYVIASKRSNLAGGSSWDFLLTTGNKLRLNIYQTDAIFTTSVDSVTAVPTNTWIHVAATYDYITSGTSVIRYYIGGNADTGGTSVGKGPVQDSPTPVTIGYRNYPPSAYSYFNGSIDEVSLYNRALSPNEIKDRSNAHSMCPAITVHNDNNDTFTRTVKFENTCRDASGNITSTTATTCSSGAMDANTKKATVNVLWGNSSQRFIESVEMYISNLFLN
jgi:prepilin-type N-terminal cleavage/methylation domain-containing protein